MSAQNKKTVDAGIPSTFLTSLLNITAEAGAAISEVYHTEFQVSYKEDRSPLTMADQRSHAIILSRLSELSPRFPVLSEEGKDIPYEERKGWEYFWLVDPLDGTKEFVKRNGEFTVNIALIHKNKPVAGLIYIPEKRTYYFAAEGLGAYKLVSDTIPLPGMSFDDLLKKAQRLPSDNRIVQGGRPVRIIGSRSHASKEFEEFIKAMKEKYPDVTILSAGSSLKFCLVAEGVADLYPRFGPTMEWDTAAGQCIVEESGGVVVDMSGKRLTYNKESLLNSNFVVCSSEPLLNSLPVIW
jgi:3'(2'), 5'-bisphosphate nucleotidase